MMKVTQKQATVFLESIKSSYGANIVLECVGLPTMRHSGFPIHEHVCCESGLHEEAEEAECTKARRDFAAFFRGLADEISGPVCPLCGSDDQAKLGPGWFGCHGCGEEWRPKADAIDGRPANEELPADTPTSGQCGKPASAHGTPLGELCHQMRERMGTDDTTA